MPVPKLAAALAALVCASPAWAGLVITSTGSDGKASVTYLDGKRLRMEHARDGEEAGHVTLFDGDAHRLVEVNGKERSYQVMTEDQGQQMRARLDAMLEQLPPEQRARAEAALAKQRAATRPAHKIEFQPLGGSETVAGYRCQRFRVLRDGKHEEEGCFIPWSSAAATREDLAPFVELGRFFEGLSAAATGGERQGNLLQELAGAPGFPAVLENVDEGGKRTLVHRLVKLERRRVPADLFAVPAGYAEAKSPLLDDASPRRARRGGPAR